jgi:hypothetical protein
MLKYYENRVLRYEHLCSAKENCNKLQKGKYLYLINCLYFVVFS